MKTLIIGDPHFKYKNIIDCEIYSKNVIEIAKKHQPDFIVILGDILDSHEIVRTQPHKLVESFFEGLSGVAPTYVLIGNHDYINNSQFLTDNHIFGPFKKWPNIFIIDAPHYVEMGNKSFVFMPYVPPGRFMDALDVLTTKYDEPWEFVDCIFAHQEFKGCKIRSDTGFKSAVGDVWDENNPFVISGHMHNSQRVGANIFYTGSSIQHSHKESQKYLFLADWDKEGEFPNEPKLTKLSLGMKVKKWLSITVDKLTKKESDKKYIDKLLTYDLHINLIGTSLEFATFKKTKLHALLVKNRVLFSYESTETYSNSDEIASLRSAKKKDVCYNTVFQTIVSKKNEFVQAEYELLFGKLSVNNESAETTVGHIELEFEDEI